MINFLVDATVQCIVSYLASQKFAVCWIPSPWGVLDVKGVLESSCVRSPPSLLSSASGSRLPCDEELKTPAYLANGAAAELARRTFRICKAGGRTPPTQNSERTQRGRLPGVERSTSRL